MRERKFSQQSLVPLIHMAVEDMASGRPKREIFERLKQAGCSDELTQEVFQKARKLKRSTFRREGQLAMIAGGSMFMVGLVITVGTMAVASGGGIYIVAYGAVLSGGGIFLKGFWQTLKG